jgi:NAD(P)-dependent dehydrogenase (short-subunit alcohol dehydrogenase family)
MAGLLRDRTVVISGGSRGIGLAILVACAREGANAVLMGKTDTPDPRLPGTVHTAAAEVEAAGGRAMAVVGDVRKDEDVARTVEAAVDQFGGVDIVINNASALVRVGTEETSLKRFDLLQDVNVRGTFALTKACLPYLRKSEHAHILTIAPPLNLAPHWLAPFPAYTQSKYAMTLLTLSWAAEFADAGIAANCLWPQTRIATAAVVNLLGGEEAATQSRSPDIMGDAAVAILSRPPNDVTGQVLIDEAVLREAGVTDFAKYGGGDNPTPDLYVD